MTIVDVDHLAAARIRSRPPSIRVIQIGLALGVLLVWEAVTQLGVVTNSALVPTSEILESLASVVVQGTTWAALGQTILSWAVGLGICIIVGVPLGALFGSRAGIYSTVRFTVEFLRATPPVVLIPFMLLFFGPTQEMKIILVVLGSIWPLIIQAMYGVHDIDPVVMETAKVYRVRGRLLAFKVVLPSITPYVMTGVRVAGVLALLLTIGAEMITSANGVGRQILYAQSASAMDRMYAYIVIAGVLGIVFNMLVAFADRRVMSWHPSLRGEQR